MRKKNKPKENPDMRSGWLYGWKDIASYVGCDLSTIKRYATNYSMPIRRLPNDKPIAIREELDGWIRSIKKPPK